MSEPTIEPVAAGALRFPTTDATEWVAAFRRAFPDANVPDDAMLGWFANAIEHGRGPDRIAAPATREPVG